MEMALDKIIIDDRLYPRNQRDWRTVARYKDAMRLGDIFPPLVLGKGKHGYVLIDGRHRRDAYASLGTKKVPVIVSQVKERDFFLEAVRLNTFHGRELSMHERIQVALRLRNEGYSDGQIAHAVRIPAENLGRLINLRVIKVIPSPATQRSLDTQQKKTSIVLKAPLKHMAGQEISSSPLQDSFATPDVGHLVTQLLILVKQNYCDKENEDLRRLLQELHHELGLYLVRVEQKVA